MEVVLIVASSSFHGSPNYFYGSYFYVCGGSSPDFRVERELPLLPTSFHSKNKALYETIMEGRRGAVA